MISGEKYIRTLNEYSTKYFLERTQKDYDESVFQKAIGACGKHAAYYQRLGMTD